MSALLHLGTTSLMSQLFDDAAASYICTTALSQTV